MIHREWHALVLMIAVSMTLGISAPLRGETLRERLKAKGELAPCPEAQPLLIEIASVIDSPALKDSIQASRTLQMLRERVRTSIFHLNFKFEVEQERYPYDPPFEAPFPFRPTIEAIEEARTFLALAQKTTGFESGLEEKLAQWPHYAELGSLFPDQKPQPKIRALLREDMVAEPVEAYLEFQERIENYGELASFPEFAEAVNGQLEDFDTDEIKALRASDPVFNALCLEAVKNLRSVQRIIGPATRTQPSHVARYPYRKTIDALMQGTLVFDIRERLKYPEGINWHDVEISWFVGNEPKLLPLYHFNRYKYQLSGLLADPEVIVFPDWVGASFEALIRLRVVPIGLMETPSKTSRIDRHHNSPLDNAYHDANHIRRMWGYDKRKQQKRGAVTKEQKVAIYREQDALVKQLLAATDPSVVKDVGEKNTRRLERVLMFETTHETALTPDRDSFLYDLLRVPATRQPFEVQVQASLADLEAIRSFDGNLRSGADQLGLNLHVPTVVRYFYDRAPGFLANVDNKLRWGFFDSVFDMKSYVADRRHRHPLHTAEAALRLFRRLGYENPPDVRTLVAQQTDHSGQPELWNYFSYADTDVVRLSGLNMLNVAAADEIHATWRRNSAYLERWKPTNAKLRDGTMVNDEWSLARYFEEQAIPHYLRQFYRLDVDPNIQETVLFEDLRNLPNELLAANHSGENLMSGAKAVSIVDRIWHRKLRFRSVDAVERWLRAAAQQVHQAVLDRNANGARNEPKYNRHWLLLPPANQKNDLELIRIAFDARLALDPKSLDRETVLIFREGLYLLYGKIARGESVSDCAHLVADWQAASTVAHD